MFAWCLFCRLMSVITSRAPQPLRCLFEASWSIVIKMGRDTAPALAPWYSPEGRGGHLIAAFTINSGHRYYTGCSWKGGTVQHPLNPWFFGLFPMFWAFFPIQYGRFSFWYSWGILLKKKFKNCILKKG